MKLTWFRIENFRSIDHLEVDALDSLVVLIGRNSAGKSNILEGLNSVFKYFDIAGGASPGIDEFTFYKRRVGRG